MEWNAEAVIEKIIQFAQENQAIRYVIQNGSRVNPSVIPDEFADFDIIMGCENSQKYTENHAWINCFGDLLILQVNELRENTACWPIFLMQFKNGLRIDMQFYAGDGRKKYQSDSLSKILLDKDSIFTTLFTPSEESYIEKQPKIEKYVKEVNNFWWCLINTAKGIARNELTYSRFMYESVVRENFLQIISWYVSAKNSWSINTGKYGKFLPKFAGTALWQKIEKTYYTDSPEIFWESLFAAADLITTIDNELRHVLQIAQPPENTKEIRSFLKTMKDKKTQK